MSGSTSQEFLRALQAENALLRGRERELEERAEELSAQKEELTAAIEAFIEKSDALEESVQKLARRNNELDQILYRTSHDLLAPLTSIEGLLHVFQLEQKTGQGSAVDLLHHMLAKVHQAKDVLKTLGTLAHASFDAIAYQEVNVLNFVRSLVADLDYLPNHKLVSFTFHIEADLSFETDPFLMGIVLKSLLANAVIFRNVGHAGEVVVRARRTERGIEFRICDDGEGIEQDKQQRIFEMFYRGSVRSIGPGLGLYVVKTLLERFGGEISLTSAPGNTCFTLAIPLQKGKGMHAPPS